MPIIRSDLPLATLVHISDLHFGNQFTTDESLFRKLVASIPLVQGVCVHSYQAACALSLRVRQILENRKEGNVPICVVFTGDLTRGGTGEEFVVGGTFLREAHSIGRDRSAGLRVHEPPHGELGPGSDGLFQVPGNHDILQRSKPDQLRAYLDHFQGLFPSSLRINTRGRPIILYGLDSTPDKRLRRGLGAGHVPWMDLPILREMIESENQIAPESIHIVCLHHPLLQLPYPELELENRNSVAQYCLNLGIHLVLAGHVHYGITYTANGTLPNHAVASTATQQFSQRGFFVLDIYEKEIELIPFVQDEQSLQFVLEDRSGAAVRFTLP
jgi:hypothetical protein